MHPSLQRPVFLDLRRIRQPVTAVVSILHRLSGLLLVLAAPFAVALFALSLRDAAGFQQAVEILASPPLRLLGLLLGWGLLHHLLAGLRFLCLDLDLGVSRTVARRSALGVLLGALILSIGLAGVWL